MTVIEVLTSCVQRVQGIRLPVAEAVATLQLTGIRDDIQACINTLTAHAEEAKAPEEDADKEPGAEAEAPEEGKEEPEEEAEG